MLLLVFYGVVILQIGMQDLSVLIFCQEMCERLVCVVWCSGVASYLEVEIEWKCR